ncbi:MAG: CDP-alcohol phosphatidyltransferase family protein [Candidatus Bipolaricaulota bacterium]|nr:CDP-alcohol phosphatidyltransferase family protein [Candidatus Bipolaricaulota bacterium]
MGRLPDLLTATRGILALVIALLGLMGPRALETVILLTILGWTTDILDGRLARRIDKDVTWVGEREFTFDMMMVFAGLCYLVMAKFIPFAPAVIYVMIAAAFIAYFRSKSVTMSFAFPLVALPLIVAYFNAPRAAWWFIIWLCLALLFDWRRFKDVVLEFIKNARAIQRR